MKRYLGLYVPLAFITVIVSILVQSKASWEESSIKAMIVPVAGFMLNLFNSPATAIILSCSIVLVGLWLALTFWFGRLAPVLRELRELSSVVVSSRSIADKDERLTKVSHVFDQSSLVSREFRLFGVALKRVGRDSPQSASYIDMSAVERAGCKITSFGQYASHIVGIGLVLTFCGLVAGLYFASKGLVAADLATARASLVQLLQASTFKFLTSIAGISTSIMIALVHQRAQSQLTDALDDLTMTIDETLG
jgi:hypothetical protein